MDKKLQQDIDELNEALSVGDSYSNIIHGGTIDVDLSVDYIEVELFELPIVSLSVDYLYRFVKPVALILSREPIRITQRLYGASNDNGQETLEKEIRAKWKESFGATQEEIDSIEGDIYRDTVSKLFNLSKVKIHYLELKRR